jgi:hypothetical protein
MSTFGIDRDFLGATAPSLSHEDTTMKTTRTVYTVQDARNEKRRADVPSAKAARLAAERQRFTAPENMHPGIGTLMTSKGLKFYAYLGPDRFYREGTVETLTFLLMQEAGQ